MIDSTSIITDAQLLAAFDSGPVKMGDVPLSAMAESCRHVAEMAIACYVDEARQETIKAIRELTESLRRLVVDTGASVLDAQFSDPMRESRASFVMPKGVAVSGGVKGQGTTACACGCGYVFAVGDIVYECIRPLPAGESESMPVAYDHYIPTHAAAAERASRGQHGAPLT